MQLLGQSDESLGGPNFPEHGTKSSVIDGIERVAPEVVLCALPTRTQNSGLSVGATKFKRTASLILDSLGPLGASERSRPPIIFGGNPETRITLRFWGSKMFPFLEITARQPRSHSSKTAPEVQKSRANPKSIFMVFGHSRGLAGLGRLGECSGDVLFSRAESETSRGGDFYLFFNITYLGA